MQTYRDLASQISKILFHIDWNSHWQLTGKALMEGALLSWRTPGELSGARKSHLSSTGSLGAAYWDKKQPLKLRKGKLHQKETVRIICLKEQKLQRPSEAAQRGEVDLQGRTPFEQRGPSPNPY